MKIVAFEVRDDERDALTACARAHEIELETCDAALTADNLSLCDGADGVSTLGKTTLDRALLTQLAARGVRAVSTRTIGFDHIDLAAAKELGLQVFNAPYGPEGVAEFTVMLMLMTLRNYKQALYRANANDYSLSGLMGKELADLTVGVVGSGRIGCRVVQLLAGFGCRVLVHDVRPQLPESIAALAEYAPLDELYRTCDMISLHLPLLDDTYHMIDKAALAKMKDGVILINCARGGLMCLEDLIDGIEHKKIGALGMDVIEEENGIYHRDLRSDILINRNMAYIRQFPNVVLTQHIAFYTDRAIQSMAENGILNIFNGLSLGSAKNRLA